MTLVSLRLFVPKKFHVVDWRPHNTYLSYGLTLEAWYMQLSKLDIYTCPCVLDQLLQCSNLKDYVQFQNPLLYWSQSLSYSPVKHRKPSRVHLFSFLLRLFTKRRECRCDARVARIHSHYSRKVSFHIKDLKIFLN